MTCSRKPNTQADALQALGDAERQSYMKGKRILEINPRHPLIQQVKDRFEADPENGPSALAKILYETALLESGFQVGDALYGDVPCHIVCMQASARAEQISVCPGIGLYVASSRLLRFLCSVRGIEPFVIVCC